MEAEPSIVCSNLMRGLGISFYEQAASDGGDPRTVWCEGDHGDASPVECTKGGGNRGP
jgi:hypothetical protein